jgi:hypothetical protein
MYCCSHLYASFDFLLGMLACAITLCRAGALTSGDLIRPWWKVDGSGLNTLILASDANGQQSIYAVKLVGSSLTPNSFSASAACPPYARITLQLPTSPFTATGSSIINTNFFVSDLSSATQASSAPSVNAGCPSPFQTFVASQGGVYIQSSGEYRATMQMTFDSCNYGVQNMWLVRRAADIHSRDSLCSKCRSSRAEAAVTRRSRFRCWRVAYRISTHMELSRL